MCLRFSQELNIGQLSAAIMWNLYSSDLKLASTGMYIIVCVIYYNMLNSTFFVFLDHTQCLKCKNCDYVNLYFRVKHFYYKYVSDTPFYKEIKPEFPR